ncbi:MAG: hypothetical protein R6U96_05625 [Promethearchaeia archaeon]
MKKIVYNLNLAIVGSLNSRKKRLLDVLESVVLEQREKRNFREFQILYHHIMFKLKIFTSASFKELKKKISDVQRLDGLMIVINVYERKFFNSSLDKKIESLKGTIEFENYKILVASEQQAFAERYKIRENELIQKAKDLDFIYCFKIDNQTDNGDILGIFHKILEDSILKFENSNPELFELAKIYGKHVEEKEEI